ncbi:glycosyltransferase involved in cell wall biosynthesis [Actinoplanes lutulentus]|uniref:Glycosyl transferase family 2 n=1 Tax=Actinoplanes lutulentus TaxID=1287878 RepID=A0A327YX05_9ACTN|nr:glycosyltransferase family 2 protein [Actinoplanes lutulentus]MBB2940421.1 glycosyltransferase involved in cell wall biosynthesis [Actinoplanes lutulentus]RAK25846.1 glycosyl transferase family 2 [Actinoplanes lutulentus]
MAKLTERVKVTAPQAAPLRDAKVSVVIPTYNYGHFLPQSVGSVLAQEGVDVEVIVVDDCSTDDTPLVAGNMAATDPRVVYAPNAENHGPCVAFNDGLARVTGDFVVRLDADDLLTPGSLSRAVQLFQQYPEVGLVYGHPLHFHSETPPEPRTDVESWTIWSGEDWIAERARLGVNCITTPEAIVRRSVYDEVGPWDPRMRYACDMEAWMRAAAVSDVGRIDGADQAFHREHGGSLSVNAGSGRLLDLRERRTAFNALFEGPGGKLPRAAELHETALRSLAVEALESACHAYDRGLTDNEPIDEYEAFALETYAKTKQLPQWRMLVRRRKVGAKLAPYMPPFAAGVVSRRLRNDARYRRWVRQGV